MSEEIPDIVFSYKNNREKIALVGDKEYEFLTDMLIDVSSIRHPDHVMILAEALNHFDRGHDFSLILDIEEYTDDFRETYAAEQENPLDPNNPSISDFSMPDLDQIREPVVEDDQITFFVNQIDLGLPYRVTGTTDGRGKLTYAPL